MNINENAVKKIKDYIKSFVSTEDTKSCDNRELFFFDLETTGLDVCKDKIVQIGYVKIKMLTDDIIAHKVLVNPGIAIPQGAINVHHITNEMVADAKPFSVYAKSLYDGIKDSIIIGFNSDRYDVLVLAEEFARCGIVWPSKDTIFIDVLSIEKQLNPRTLIHLHKKYFETDYSEDAHDALNDVYATVNVLSAQLDQLDKPLSVISNDCRKNVVDLAGKLSRNDSGEIIYAFGKNQGKRVIDDRNYAIWMLSQDFHSSTKNIIRELINK